MTTPQNELTPGSDFAPATREMWLKLVEKALKGADFEKRCVALGRWLRIEPLYTRADAIPAADAAVPGAAPFTRGTTPRSTASAGAFTTRRRDRSGGRKQDHPGGVERRRHRRRHPQRGARPVRPASDREGTGAGAPASSSTSSRCNLPAARTRCAPQMLASLLGQAGHRRPRPPRRVQRRSPRRQARSRWRLSQSISAAIGLAAGTPRASAPTTAPSPRSWPTDARIMRRAAARRRNSPA